MKASRAARAAQVSDTPPVRTVREQASPSLIAPIYPLTVPKRLLIAFLIGLPTTMMFPFNIIPNPFWWQPDIPILVLLITLLVGIARDPVVQEKRIEQKRVTNSTITVVLIMVAYFLGEVVLLNINGVANIIGYVLMPVVVGVVAGFTLGGGKTKGLSLFCGVAAWLGAAIGNVLAITYNIVAYVGMPDFAKTNKHVTLGSALSTYLVIAALLHFTGLAIGAWGGELGWRLRKKLLGPDSVLETSWQTTRKGQ